MKLQFRLRTLITAMVVICFFAAYTAWWQRRLTVERAQLERARARSEKIAQQLQMQVEQAAVAAQMARAAEIQSRSDLETMRLQYEISKQQQAKEQESKEDLAP